MAETVQREIDPYAEPAIYDILYTPGTAREVDLVERIARRWGTPRGEKGVWLEPACGSGRYLRVLAGRGHSLVGFDRSEAMLRYARASLRRRGLDRRVRLLEADMEDFSDRLGGASFDLALCPVNSLRHLLDAAAVRRHLEQIHRVLRPGGLYLVGISFSRYGEEEPSEDVWSGARGRCRVRQIVQYLPPDRRSRRERVLSHLQVDRPRGREYLDSAYDLRSYDEKQWTTLVRRAGFAREGGIDDLGRDVGDEPVAYQLDVLRRR